MKKRHEELKELPPQKKIKVLCYGDSVSCATGFGTVMRNILSGLYVTNRYEIEQLSINYWGDKHNFPWWQHIVGLNTEKDPYGRRKVFNLIQQMDFDLLFFLQDTFILDFLPELHTELRKKGKAFRSICYYPIDGTPKEQWIRNIDACDYTVAYSEFGKNESMKILPDMKEPQVIPHGANVKDYFVASEKDVSSFRAQFFGPQANKFIFTNINRNQQRKDIPRTIAAFKEFKKQVPESLLYLHCFSEGTEVRIFNGIKNIEDIKIGDVVLTKNGTFKEVYEISERDLSFDETMLTLKVSGRNDRIVSTANHRFLVIRTEKTPCHHDYCLPTCSHKWVYRKESWVSNCKADVYNNYSPEWVEAKNLKENDYLLIPIMKNNIGDIPSEIKVSDIFDLNNQLYIETNGFIKTSNHPKAKSIPNTLLVTKELMRLFGYYLSEGCVRGTMDTVQFTFNIEEKEYIKFVVTAVKDIFGMDSVVREFPEVNTTQITICGTVMARFFKLLLGHSAHTKVYPEWFNFLNDNLFFELIRGIFDGDGCYGDRLISYSSISKALSYLIRDGLLRRKFFASIRDTFRPDGRFNGFQLVMCSDIKRLYDSIGLNSINVKDSNKEYYHFFLDDYVACKICEIRISDYIGKVYNMSVRDDESYCVSGGFIAHNCAKKDQGWNLEEVVKAYGLDLTKDVIFPENFGPNQGYPRQIVNLIYNASDCVISTTLGEGFGLSWPEAMATKTPVIMPANTAMVEYITEDRGWLCKSGTNSSLFTVVPNDNEVVRPLVDVDDLAEKMLEVYNNKKEVIRRTENAYSWIHSEMDWATKIVPRWLKVFDAAYEDLVTTKEKGVEELPKGKDIINAETF